MMDYLAWWHGMTPSTITGLTLALLCTASFVGWRVRKWWNFRTRASHGSLLLQIELNDIVYAHIAMLTAEAWTRKPRYTWAISQMNKDDFPYTQMTDLPFTHIVVTQNQNEKHLVTISVIDRPTSCWRGGFYWINNVTIGNRPGFPRKLLLPHNFVLKYVDSTN